MSYETNQLLSCQFQREQFEKQAVSCRNYTAGTDSSDLREELSTVNNTADRETYSDFLIYPSTHPSLASCFSTALLPRFQVLDFVVDFVDNLMVSLQVHQIHWKKKRNKI